MLRDDFGSLWPLTYSPSHLNHGHVERFNLIRCEETRKQYTNPPFSFFNSKEFERSEKFPLKTFSVGGTCRGPLLSL